MFTSIVKSGAVIARKFPFVKPIFKKIGLSAVRVIKTPVYADGYFDYTPPPPARQRVQVAMRLELHDCIQRGIYLNKIWDKQGLDAAFNMLPQNGVFFDIGANVGAYSYALHKKAREVHCFEAVKSTCDILQNTIQNNHIANIFPHNFAVHNRDNLELSMIESDGYGELSDNRGAFSLWNKGKAISKVKTITLDSFCEQNKISKIDLVKMDTEGNELFVLQGMKKVLQIMHPTIKAEYSPKSTLKAGYNAEEIIAFLKEFGYSVKIEIENHESGGGELYAWINNE